MGMFDSVYVECPHCFGRNEHQSKSGECQLNEYTLDDAPAILIEDIANEQNYCEHCSKTYIIRARISVSYRVLKVNGEEMYD